MKVPDTLFLDVAKDVIASKRISFLVTLTKDYLTNRIRLIDAIGKHTRSYEPSPTHINEVIRLLIRHLEDRTDMRKDYEEIASGFKKLSLFDAAAELSLGHAGIL